MTRVGCFDNFGNDIEENSSVLVVIQNWGSSFSSVMTRRYCGKLKIVRGGRPPPMRDAVSSWLSPYEVGSMPNSCLLICRAIVMIAQMKDFEHTLTTKGDIAIPSRSDDAQTKLCPANEKANGRHHGGLASHSERLLSHPAFTPALHMSGTGMSLRVFAVYLIISPWHPADAWCR